MSFRWVPLQCVLSIFSIYTDLETCSSIITEGVGTLYTYCITQDESTNFISYLHFLMKIVCTVFLFSACVAARTGGKTMDGTPTLNSDCCRCINKLHFCKLPIMDAEIKLFFNSVFALFGINTLFQNIAIKSLVVTFLKKNFYFLKLHDIMQTEKIEASYSSTKGKFCKQYMKPA